MGWYGPQSGDCSCCGGSPPGSCEILIDGFNRSDSSDLGSEWSEESGSWAIVSNTLQGTGSGAVAITTSERASASVNYTVAATVSNRGRIVFDADGAGNYHYIEYNSSSSAIALGNQSGAIQGTIIPNLSNYQTPTTELVMKACVLGGLVIVNFGNIGTGAASFTFSPHDGLHAGLGSGLAGTRTFEDFSYKVHEDSIEGCDLCVGGCDSDCCSESVTLEYSINVPSLTITGVDCDCAGVFGGGEMTLMQYAPCRWRYNNYDPDASIGDCYYGAELSLSGCEWTLEVFFGYYFDDPDSPGIDAGVDNRAFYTYTQSDPSDCGEFSYSLSRASFTTPGVCDLTWPLNVSLTPVA